VIVQDWQYWGNNKHWNSTKFDKNYPDPKQMVDSVHQLHAHIVISVWPSFGKKTKIYRKLNRHGFLYDLKTWPPHTADRVYDVFNPKARDIYWKFMNRNLFSRGIDGWWLDSTEPDQLNPNKDGDVKTYQGLFATVRNAFPIETVGGVYRHQREETSRKRVVILARAAFAGQQRYSSLVWSGDTQSSWKALKAQITNGLNMAFSGIPYWTNDIGGFFSHGNYPHGNDDPAFQELYVRWLEFGTFCPIMRSHGSGTPREIYRFGKKGYWAYDAIDRFINLRYRLMPYIYSEAWRVTSKSRAFMRALVMDFPSDKKVRDINNEFMFGPSFLVAPVTRPMYTHRINKDSSRTNFKKVKKRNVYLPKGSDWYNFWTGKKITGGRTIASKAPINIIPLYVKAGSIVPMGPFEQFATQKQGQPVEIRVYSGADGHFTLYDDQGNNYNYKNGAYSLISFKWDNSQRTMTISKRQGSFPGMAKNRKFKIVIVNKNKGTGVKETSPTNEKIIGYNGTKKVIHF